MFWLWKIFRAKKPYLVEIIPEEKRHWRAIIRDWQNREKRHGTNEIDVPTYFYGEPKTVYVKRVLREVQKRIKYVSDTEQYKKINHYPTSKQVWATKKDDCIANYEEVYVKDGIKMVGDLKVGDEVLSYDFENEKFVYKKIINIWEKGTLPLKRVSTRKEGINIRSIDITENTPLMLRSSTHKSNKFLKKKLSSINMNSRGNVTPVAKEIPYIIKDIRWLTEGLCFVLGHYLAEGWKTKKYNRIFTSGYDIDIIKNILDDHSIKYSDGHKNSNGTPYIELLKKGVTKFRSYLKVLKEDSYDINIPEEIFHLPKNKLLSILDGHFLGDGHYQKEDKYYSTVSDKLSSDFVRIHLQLGKPINGYLQTDHQGLGNKPIWRLSSGPLNKVAGNSKYEGLGQVGINSITDITPYETRDFEVEDTHVFFFKNGMMCHNCDGQAIAVWKALELQEFPEDEIGMGIVDGHMFAVWHDPELINDFWVLDNGFLSRKMVKASKLFPCKYRGRLLEPLYGFNVHSWWSYVKI